MKKRRIGLCLLLTVSMCLIASPMWAEDVRGVTKNEIKLACLVDFSGPGKFAGPPLALGAETYIKYVNDQGGVHGRKINLIVEDNGILPNTTITAARKVILKDGVFAIGFNLGSAGSSAILPICEENQAVLMPHGANKKFAASGKSS